MAQLCSMRREAAEARSPEPAVQPPDHAAFGLVGVHGLGVGLKADMARAVAGGQPHACRATVNGGVRAVDHLDARYTTRRTRGKAEPHQHTESGFVHYRANRGWHTARAHALATPGDKESGPSDVPLPCCSRKTGPSSGTGPRAHWRPPLGSAAEPHIAPGQLTSRARRVRCRRRERG